jgi:hypothetical protein
MVPKEEIITPNKLQSLQRTLYGNAKENERWKVWSLYADLCRQQRPAYSMCVGKASSSSGSDSHGGAVGEQETTTQWSNRVQRRDKSCATPCEYISTSGPQAKAAWRQWRRSIARRAAGRTTSTSATARRRLPTSSTGCGSAYVAGSGGNMTRTNARPLHVLHRRPAPRSVQTLQTPDTCVSPPIALS